MSARAAPALTASASGALGTAAVVGLRAFAVLPEWRCSRCRHFNFRDKRECQGCRKPHPQLKDAQKVEPAAGASWRCVRCRKPNVHTTLQCSECMTPKPTSTWTCPSPGCGQVNLGVETKCSKCWHMRTEHAHRVFLPNQRQRRIVQPK